MAAELFSASARPPHLPGSLKAQESHGLSTGQPSPMVGHQAARVSEQDTTADRPTLPPGPGPGAKISAAALDALEKRVTNALRALQARQERNLEEAVQVLVGQLWAAYFSIGSLQAHQQALQAHLHAAIAGGELRMPPGWQGMEPAGRGEGPGAGDGDPVGDSLMEETCSVSLEQLGRDAQDHEAFPAADLPSEGEGCWAEHAQHAYYPQRSQHAPRPHQPCSTLCCKSTSQRGAGAEGLHAATAAAEAEVSVGGGPRDSGGRKEGQKRHHPRWASPLRREQKKRRKLEKEVEKLKGLVQEMLPRASDCR